MHQDLVDHDLEEERREQGEELQEERRQQHLAQQAAIFVEGAREPADVEPPGDVAQPGAAHHQHKAAGPCLLELLLRHDLGLAGAGHMHQHLVRGRLAHQQERAVAQLGNTRQRRARKPRPPRRQAARLEAELTRAAEHLDDPDGFAGHAELVMELGRFRCHALQTQQRNKGCEPCVVCRHIECSPGSSAGRRASSPPR